MDGAQFSWHFSYSWGETPEGRMGQSHTSLHGQLARWCKLRVCEVGKVKEWLENELWHRWSNRRVGEWAVTYVKWLENELWCRWRDRKVGEWAELINIDIYSRAHSPTSFTSPTSQLILQPFCRITYVTAHSPTLLLLHLRHSSFTNPSFALPTSQALHLRHLASCTCFPQTSVPFSPCYQVLYFSIWLCIIKIDVEIVMNVIIVSDII